MPISLQPGRNEQFLLPFAEKEWTSLGRAARILGVGVGTIYRLRSMRDDKGEPLLRVVDYGNGLRKRVRYSSIVGFCDYLRRLYGIPDRRPPLESSIFRHRDEDLLPFPLSDTMSATEALGYVGYEDARVIHHRAEEGVFEAYQILPLRGSPWRISRSDFARWLRESMGQQ